MKVMSFNILCGGPEGHSWPERKALVADTIRKEMPDSFGVQEAHYNWMQILVNALPEYDYVGVGRDDGDKKGEFSAVFYKKDAYNLLDSGTFWLSETPDRPGKGWDAACIRVCSWAKLENKENGKVFVHFNTHLDHVGLVAMQKGAELVTKKAAEICPDAPAFFTGDFNVTPESAPYATVIANGFSDSRLLAPETDNGPTFHADVVADTADKKHHSIIDYCFVKGDIEVKSYKVIRDLYDGNLHPSDHYPVVAEIEF